MLYLAQSLKANTSNYGGLSNKDFTSGDLQRVFGPYDDPAKPSAWRKPTPKTDYVSF